MSLTRKCLSLYRSAQNFIFQRKLNGVGFTNICHCEVLNDSTIDIDLCHGDIVHPCVRFCQNKFKGHHWWMAYTPYYKASPAVENPILCWGEGDENTIPTKWHFESYIQPGHKKGYNSDPFILHHDNKLYCFWRENSTEYLNRRNLHHGTFCKYYDENGNWSDISLVMPEKYEFQDRETCPAITISNNKLIGLGMSLKFKNEGIRKLLSNKGKVIYDKICNVFDLLGIYSQQKFYGVALWEGTNFSDPFNYIQTVPIYGVNHLYKPWHMDIFDYSGNQYMVIQSNQCNADICLAKKSENGTFNMYPIPLLTNKDISKMGIYKPTAGVIKNVFYLFFTAQDINNRNLNKMYLATMPFNLLLKKIDQ